MTLPVCPTNLPKPSRAGYTAQNYDGRVRRQPRAFDLLLFRRGTRASHIGIAISNRIMLHMASGDHAKIECQTHPRWAWRFAGAWRPVNLSMKGTL